MLIVLDLTPAALESVDSSLLHERVGEMLYSHRLGRNLLVLGRDTQRWLSANVSLSSIEKATFSRIVQGIAQTGNLHRVAASYIRIGLPHSSFERVDSRQINLPIDHRGFGSLMLAPALVIEDVEYDTLVYSAIFAGHANRPGGFPCCFEPSHGGGGRVAPVVKAHIKHGRIVCAVVDSDRVAPTQACVKADELREKVENADWPCLFIFELPCAEVENLVPLDLFRDAFAASSAASIQFLQKVRDEEERLGVAHELRLWMFFDIKRGLDSQQLERIDAASQAWLKSKLLLADLSLESFQIQGFGRSVIQELFRNRAFCASFVKTTATAAWRHTFSQIIDAIYWIIIAPTPQYAI